MYPAFDIGLRQAIFEDMICKQLYANPSGCTGDAYDCFESLLVLTKVLHKNCPIYMEEDSMEVYDLDLCGIDVLWKITIEGNDGCFKKAGNLLLSLYRNVTTYNESTHKQFLDRCFKELRRKKSEGDESEDARTDLVREQSRVIFLFEKVCWPIWIGKSLAHENRGRGAPFKVKIRVKKINSTYSQSRLHSQQQNNRKYWSRMCMTCIPI